MTDKKSSSTSKSKKSATKKEDVIDVRVEELMPPRAKVSFACRLFIYLSFIGVSLLVYDKIEPGNIPFFAEKEKPVCQNPIHDVADQVNQFLVGFSSQIKGILKEGNTASTVVTESVDLDEVVGTINQSKDEIINSFNEYLNGFKDLALETKGEAQEKIKEQMDTVKKVAAEDSKKQIVVDLVYNKVSSILKSENNLDGVKNSLSEKLKALKSELLQPVNLNETQNAESTSEDEITKTIKGALSKFVKVKKVDDKRVMLEQLFMESEELIDTNEFEALVGVLKEIRSISGNQAADALIAEAESIDEMDEANIRENLKEVLSLIAKLK